MNIWLEKRLQDSVEKMYLTFACLVGLIEYMYVLKRLEMLRK